MKIVRAKGAELEKIMKRLDGRMKCGPVDVSEIVAKIILNVKKRGDKAISAYNKKYDGIDDSFQSIRVAKLELNKSFKDSDRKVILALEKSAERIRAFHRKQKESSWSYYDKGTTLGQIIRPLLSAGLYVPGGKASYPSSVLMNAIPAKIAGVKRIVMVTPAPKGLCNPHTLAAAKIAGVDEIYRMGGAQAIAALAFGTKSINPVDKIVGPGNVFVAEAKRQVFGFVDIDMIAGPSEILILADRTANPAFIAADLLSQAEHDENAYPILVTTNEALAMEVAKELKAQIKVLPRKEIIRKCLKKNCFCFVVNNLKEAFDVSNRFAPEHFELSILNADRHVKRIRNAGAVFVGQWTPEAIGDYCAGPNHVLPTGGSARFSSPLGVYDFMKRTSLIKCNREGLERLSKPAITVAAEEGLTAHAKAVSIRLNKSKL